MQARAGQGDMLAQLMLRVAEGLEAAPGCELYVVSRSPTEPDVI